MNLQATKVEDIRAYFQAFGKITDAKLKMLIWVLTSLFDARSTCLYKCAQENAFLEDTNIDYDHHLSGKSAIDVELNYLYTQKRGLLPDDIKLKNVSLRDFTYIPPLIIGRWDENSFAPYRLSTKPDAYFDFNIVVKYLFDVWCKKQNYCRIGLGAVLNYHDEKEIVGFIKGSFRSLVGFAQIQDASIPIFQYDTYMDLGVMSQFSYERRIKDYVSWGLVSKWYAFPKSEKYITTLYAFIGFKF